jgi:hypothetical protein
MNQIFKIIGDSILSSWIWQFTVDWFHPVISGIVLFFLLRILLRKTRMRSLLISLVSQIIALGSLSIIAIGVLVHIFGWEFDPLDPYEGIKQIAMFKPSLMLGLYYAISQTLFYVAISFFWNINVVGWCVSSWLSNGIGAILSYLLISVSEIMKYTG